MVKLQRFIDKYAGFFLVLFLSLFKFLRKNKKEKIKRILVIKLWAIGDSVLTLSLIRAISEKYKNARIDVLTRKRISSVFKASSKVDNILYADTFLQYFNFIFRTQNYNLVFDCEPYLNISAVLGFLKGDYMIGFSNQWRSRLYNKAVKFNKKQHMVQNYLDMIRTTGFKYDVKELEKLETKKQVKEKVNDFWKKNKLSGLVIGITPGVAESAKSRMWFANRFAKLADRLIKEKKAKIIFIDSKKNKKVIHKILSLMEKKAVNAAGEFKLDETFYVIEKCNVFICNDTGPMHIAAAQGCKTVGLFGPNTPVLWGPYGKKNKAIYKTKLAPSIQNDKGIAPNRNRKEYMGPISVDDVFKEVNKLL